MGIPPDRALLETLRDLTETGHTAPPSRAAVRVDVVPGKGRGVIAARAILRGEVIERAPVVIVPSDHIPHVERTVLDHYVYDWTDGRLAVALGFGSLYNHSYAPNAFYVKREDGHTIDYVALVDIEAGSEVTVNYNGDPADVTPLWFDVV